MGNVENWWDFLLSLWRNNGRNCINFCIGWMFLQLFLIVFVFVLKSERRRSAVSDTVQEDDIFTRLTSLPAPLPPEDLTGRFFKSRWTICRPLSRFDLLQLRKKNKLTRQNNADEANASSFSVLAYFNLELVLLYERFQLSIKSGVQKVSRRFCLKSPKFSFNFVVLGGLDQNFKYRCSCRLPSKYSVIWWNSWCTLRHQCSYLMAPCGPLIPPGGFCLRWWSCSLMEKTT